MIPFIEMGNTKKEHAQVCGERGLGMRCVVVCTSGYPMTGVFRVLEPGDMARENSEIKGEPN